MNVQVTAHSMGFVAHASRSWGTCSGLVRGFVLGNVFVFALGLGNALPLLVGKAFEVGVGLRAGGWERVRVRAWCALSAPLTFPFQTPNVRSACTLAPCTRSKHSVYRRNRMKFSSMLMPSGVIIDSG